MNRLQKDILSLNQGETVYGPAPHKPVLLLAVIDMFESNEIFQNWIEPTEALVVRFRSIWSTLVQTNHSPTFALPFFHLKNEKSRIWELIPFPGRSIPLTRSNSIKSYKALRDSVAAARLSGSLFKAISHPVEREVLKGLILNRYFPETRNVQYHKSPYEANIRKEMVYDGSENYARKIKKKLKELPKDLKEQEVIVRSYIFRNAILEIYNKRCAISGLQIDFKGKAGLIDACHIRPFAESFDDTIRNGIALSPHLHRAFDQGMIALSDDYTVLLHRQVKDLSSGCSIKQFKNKRIALPGNVEYYPDLGKIEEHRKRFGF
ncbi:HNH endonuclease [Marinilabilia salmonicolor]|uniref:HNH endonuclease n=1 Tax=Marinilabilia salmonicolor TaxID=989 RepID=UPI00029A44D3|nr:HNH endonuclease [Marinilabilia salmonicolor]